MFADFMANKETCVYKEEPNKNNYIFSQGQTCPEHRSNIRSDMS